MRQSCNIIVNVENATINMYFIEEDLQNGIYFNSNMFLAETDSYLVIEFTIHLRVQCLIDGREQPYPFILLEALNGFCLLNSSLLLTLPSKYHPQFINRTPNEPHSSEMIDRKVKSNRHYSS